VREIQTKIRAAEHGDSLELITIWAARPDDLLQSLNEHKPHIVHFSGHGSSTEKIILLDQQGSPKPVSKGALISLFRTLKDNIRVVLLNACFSQPQAAAITSEIDCAIGMTRAIGDDAAITFAASFYRAIGFGRSIKEAFDQGITALLLEGIPEENTPHLVTRQTITPESIVLISPPLLQRIPDHLSHSGEKAPGHLKIEEHAAPCLWHVVAGGKKCRRPAIPSTSYCLLHIKELETRALKRLDNPRFYDKTYFHQLIVALLAAAGSTAAETLIRHWDAIWSKLEIAFMFPPAICQRRGDGLILRFDPNAGFVDFFMRPIPSSTIVAKCIALATSSRSSCF
jgi:hypothetical protein